MRQSRTLRCPILEFTSGNYTYVLYPKRHVVKQGLVWIWTRTTDTISLSSYKIKDWKYFCLNGILTGQCKTKTTILRLTGVPLIRRWTLFTVDAWRSFTWRLFWRCLTWRFCQSFKQRQIPPFKTITNVLQFLCKFLADFWAHWEWDIFSQRIG